MASKKSQGRVIAKFYDEGVLVPVNSLVSGAESFINELETIGKVDTDKKAVAYCKKHKAVVVDLKGTGSLSPEQAQAESLVDLAKKKELEEAEAAEKLDAAKQWVEDAKKALETASDEQKEQAQAELDAAVEGLENLTAEG